MKSAIILTVAFAAFLFTACSNDGSSKKADGDTSTATTPALNNTVATGAVMHYICPKNCAGSGGDAAGTCPVCGSEYTHNDAYHNQPAPPPGAAPAAGPLSDPASPVITPPAPTATEPAQNAAGVFHYTCSKGCAGGSGTAGTCAKCGGELAHNAAYHQ
ncbi:MAG: hypothetical protein KF852_00110 [Saprospiraceae bacterium]|nr:hypothetical protein [Saprospiraceae bacterium]